MWKRCFKQTRKHCVTTFNTVYSLHFGSPERFQKCHCYGTFTQAFLKLNFSISVFEFPELLKRISSTGTVFYSLNTAKELAKSIPKWLLLTQIIKIRVIASCHFIAYGKFFSAIIFERSSLV